MCNFHVLSCLFLCQQLYLTWYSCWCIISMFDLACFCVNSYQNWPNWRAYLTWYSWRCQVIHCRSCPTHDSTSSFIFAAWRFWIASRCQHQSVTRLTTDLPLVGVLCRPRRPLLQFHGEIHQLLLQCCHLLPFCKQKHTIQYNLIVSVEEFASMNISFLRHNIWLRPHWLF